MFGTVYKVTNESIQTASSTEADALTPGDGVDLKDDVMRFVMTSNNSNILNLVVDIPRLLEFEIMVRYSIYIYTTFRSLKQHITLCFPHCSQVIYDLSHARNHLRLPL